MKLHVLKDNNIKDIYEITETNQPYERYGTAGEYSKGGYLIKSVIENSYVGNFSKFDTVLGFLTNMKCKLIFIEYDN